jgi:proline dehydrogenase
MLIADRLVARALPLVPKQIVGRVAATYIAGTDLTAMVACVRDLNARGMRATVDVLGENITSRAESREVVDEYERVLGLIRSEHLDANLSIKPTAFGLELSPELCCEQVLELVRDAASDGTFVRIDMESSAATDLTLDLYERLRDEGHDNVGVVLQAMLRRTVDDARRLAARGAEVRVCKGIYREPRRIAFDDPEIVRRSYLETCRVLVSAGCRVAFATHDERLVWEVRRLVDELEVPPERYEMQMLLGVQEELRGLVVAEGRPMRVYVPYGARWYEYSVRRLQENPRIAGYVTSALVGRITRGVLRRGSSDGAQPGSE